MQKNGNDNDEHILVKAMIIQFVSSEYKLKSPVWSNIVNFEKLLEIKFNETKVAWGNLVMIKCPRL